ncbi:MAG: ankyrin repeat domain-containing protein, partial [Abitibacteriaceae bacterium]|nr:ankyrin repeat domain-containing protein [Abditibacteriaceae bacterium]
LQAGADVNERFEEGSPLASAAIAGGAGWHARRNHIRLMQALLRHGAKLESRDANGWTPLMYAASPQDNLFDDKPDFSACEVLLSHGANINAHDNLGRTALMHAIAAEPKIQNAHEFAWDENEDPSRQAEFNVRVMKFLLTHGADLNAHDNRGWTPLKLALAPMHSPFDTGGGHSSPPPWSLAAQQKRRLTAIQLLLSHGANVNVRDERGWTPLMGALQIYYEGNEPNPVIALAPIRLLLAHGANVNARAKDGTTALLLAHKEHDAEQVLRAAGAK